MCCRHSLAGSKQGKSRDCSRSGSKQQRRQERHFLVPTSHMFFRGSPTVDRVPKALWESWFPEARGGKWNLSVPRHGSMVSATTHSAAVKRLLHVAVQPLIAQL